MAKPVTHSVNFLSAAEDDLHRYIFNFTYFNLTQRALIHLRLIMFLSEVRQKKKLFLVADISNFNNNLVILFSVSLAAYFHRF